VKSKWQKKNNNASSEFIKTHCILEMMKEAHFLKHEKKATME
jgi:hypothetical protein